MKPTKTKKKLINRLGNTLLFMIVSPITLVFILPYLYISKIIQLIKGE